MSKQKPTGLTITALGSIPMILVLGNSMLIPILPKMKAVLNLSQFKVSLVITAFSAAAAISIPIMGYLSDRFCRKAVIIPSLILFGAGGILAGSAAAWFGDYAYIWLLIGRVIQGIGGAGTAYIAMALAGDLFKGGEQSKVLGIIEASNGFGKVVSPILGSLLALIIWYAIFFAFPVFCLISILLTLFFVKEKAKSTKPLSPGAYTKGLFSVFKHEGLWLIVTYFTGTACLLTLFGILFYLSDILEKRYHINGLLKGFILAVPLLFMTTTSYITGAKIMKKLKLMKILIVAGLLLMTLSFAILVFFSKLIPFISILAVSSIGTGLVLPCINSFITGSVNKELRGFVTSLYGSVRFIGVAAGPPIYGWLMGWSRSGMFLCTAALTLLSGILTLLFIHVSENQTTEETTTSLFQKLKLTTR
ncbi:ACDE family multidrug resistance protein [Scopulibacillus daqui]|uniref:ACDE family multidrug resistance protein n=1 Tax=Scopulibacillus daqui TaxID=1469162 RepID=A0ABS2PWB4_9BACL|nr:ACDE family multidrug resistance protein [Scopulibacillus daqui]